MKPVRLEVLVDNKTGKGLSSVDKSVAQTTKNFKIEIESQKSFIQDLERQIRSVEKEISRTSNDSQKKEINTLAARSRKRVEGRKELIDGIGRANEKGYRWHGVSSHPVAESQESNGQYDRGHR